MRKNSHTGCLALLFVIITLAAPFTTGAEEKPNDVLVYPEKATAVELSSTDVNRIICPEQVTDYVFSQEKGMTVSVNGRNLFVKYLITLKDGKNHYNKTPNEIFITTGGHVYSLITYPTQIPSKTVWLAMPKESRLKENIRKYSSLPQELKILELVKMTYRGETAQDVVAEKKNKKITVIHGVNVFLNQRVHIEGEGLAIKVFSLENTGDSSVQLNEKLFLAERISQRPLAIAIEKVLLNPNETGRLFVVEKVHVEQDQG